MFIGFSTKEELLQEFPVGTKVQARKPDRQVGKVTGSFRQCGLEGCTGTRVEVLWKDGAKTRPCSKGLVKTAKGYRLA